MTKSELIKALEEFPDDMEVYHGARKGEPVDEVDSDLFVSYNYETKEQVQKEVIFLR